MCAFPPLLRALPGFLASPSLHRLLTGAEGIFVFSKPPSLPSPSRHSSTPLVHLLLCFIHRPTSIQLRTVASESPGERSRERDGRIPLFFGEDEEGCSQRVHVWPSEQATQLRCKNKQGLFWLQELRRCVPFPLWEARRVLDGADASSAIETASSARRGCGRCSRA